MGKDISLCFPLLAEIQAGQSIFRIDQPTVGTGIFPHQGDITNHHKIGFQFFAQRQGNRFRDGINQTFNQTAAFIIIDDLDAVNCGQTGIQHLLNPLLQKRQVSGGMNVKGQHQNSEIGCRKRWHRYQQRQAGN